MGETETDKSNAKMEVGQKFFPYPIYMPLDVTMTGDDESQQ